MPHRSSALQVSLDERSVRHLSAACRRRYRFLLGADWLAWSHALPASPSLPLDTVRDTGTAVTAVFDDLLRDNDDMRRRIVGRVGAAILQRARLIGLL